MTPFEAYMRRFANSVTFAATIADGVARFTIRTGPFPILPPVEIPLMMPATDPQDEDPFALQLAEEPRFLPVNRLPPEPVAPTRGGVARLTRRRRPVPAGRPLCRSCSLAAVNRPRGLCWSCYYAPGLRESFGPMSRCGRRGIGHGSTGLPDAPTTAAPGTPEKLAVLEARVKAGNGVWHPADAMYPGDPRPLLFIQTRLAG